LKSQEFLSEADKGPLKVIRGAVLIDGRGGQPVKDPVIVIQGRHIRASARATIHRRCREMPSSSKPKAARSYPA
jgi:hypothetical protein